MRTALEEDQTSDTPAVTGTHERSRRGMWQLSLRARLILLVVACVVPLTAFTLVREYFGYREAIESSGQKTLELARSLSIAIEKDLQAHIVVLQVMALSRLLQLGDLDAFRQQAELVIAQQFPGTNIVLIREDGRQVMNTLVPIGAPLPVRANIEADRTMFATGQPTVSNLFQGAIDNRNVVTINVPVRRAEGTIAYGLSISPRLEAFADTIRRQHLPEGWLASVLDRQGATIARNVNPQRYIGQKAVPALVQRVLAEREGVFVTHSREGIEVVTAFSHIEPFGWSIALGVPLSELTAPAVSAVWRVLAAAGVALLVGLTLAVVVSRQVTGPMATLQRLAARADDDDEESISSTGLDEADGVVQALRVAKQRRTRAEMKRNEAERQSERLFETSQDLILVLDGTGRCAKVSPSSEKQIGYRPEEMIGRRAQEFIFAEDLEVARNEMRAARSGSAIRDFRCRYVHKDGRLVALVWVTVWSEPDLCYFAIGRDMTQYERTEEQLRQAQKMEAVGQLTGGVAHDFNNILMVIMANIEILEEDEGLDPELRDHIDKIAKATQRAADLTRQLLAFSRKQVLRPRSANINDFVAATGALLRSTLGEQIEIESILADDLWNAEIDRAQLESALVNLSINARDAMPEGGRLLIETCNTTLDEDYVAHNPDATSGDYVMLAVTDTGSGMPPDVVNKVFEPFFTTKGVGKGTGLGLSMVYGFIKQSKGHIKIYSEIGRGTSIRLYLPRSDGGYEEDVSRQSAPSPRGSERILIVEDDAQVRASVVRQLQSLGYAVVDASDGPSALAAFEAAPQPYDLLLTDVIMPGPLNGKALADEVIRRWPRTKIVFMSGYTENAIVHQGRLDPGVRLLSKPFRKADLALVIRQALDDIGDPER